MRRLETFRRSLIAMALIVFTTLAASADTRATRLDGRPAFSEGDALGYFVWREGDTWKVFNFELDRLTG
jgi:hypothetical protein